LAALIYLRWVDFQEAEREAIAVFEEASFEPAASNAALWRSWHSLPAPSLVEVLHESLGLETPDLATNRASFVGTSLRRAAHVVCKFGRMSPAVLDAVVEWLAAQPFETPSDRRKLLESFDGFLAKSTSPERGEHRTPESVARLIVELAAPAAGDRIYDPCFGYAGVLCAASDYVQRQEKGRFSRGDASSLSVFGLELNQDSYVIGLARLALAGVAAPQIEIGNSLERVPPDSSQQDGFDIVVANPPWNARVDSAGLDHFRVKTRDSNGLFIQHALAQLRPEGRAVVVVPEGFLFSARTQQLRRMLLNLHEVTGVVSLPAGVFPHTEVKTSILVLRPLGPTQTVRMVDAEPFFEKALGREPLTRRDEFAERVLRKLKPRTLRHELAEEIAQNLKTAEPSNHCWDVDVKTLAEIDWDLSPRRRDKSRLEEALESVRETVETLPLKEVCDVVAGRSIRSAELTDEPELVDAIPYVRIRDLKKGHADTSSSWLSAKASEGIDRKLKLRHGDVLLSKSGTIGKAGIVRNGAVGAVPAQGLYLLRCDQSRLDPHFLVAYFASREARNWLQDRARGTKVLHLSRGGIEDLPVPLPPLQIQQRVAARFRDLEGDALTSLLTLLREDEDDPISESLHRWISTFQSFRNTWAHGRLADGNWRDRLRSLESSWSPAPINRCADCREPYWTEEGLNNPSYVGPPHEYEKGADRVCLACWLGAGPNPERGEELRRRSPLADWSLALNEALGKLRGISSIPPGPSLFSLLKAAEERVHEAGADIAGRSASESEAWELTSVLTALVHGVSDSMLRESEIAVTESSGAVQAGETANVRLQVHNRGPLPLRSVTVTTEPDWGGAQFDYVAENSKETVHLTGGAPKVPGNLDFTVRWSAVTLDGQEIQNSRSIALQVVEPSTTAGSDASDLGGSPYICGDPVRPGQSEVFVGREELLAQIRRQVAESGNVVLLEGNRRSGKSSVLRHLEGTQAIPGWLGVYCSLQSAEGSQSGVGVPTDQVFREIAASIVRSVQSLGVETPLPDGTTLLPEEVASLAGKKRIRTSCKEGISEAHPFPDFRDYLEIALDFLADRELGILLMLDEFDKLQDGIDRGITSPQVPENIRFLVHEYPQLSAILTGSRVISRLKDEYWSALFGLSGLELRVSFLSRDAGRRLIENPVKGRLTYSDEAIERAFHLTSGQPYLLQCLCNRVFDVAAQREQRSITIDLVEEAAAVLVHDNTYFRSLWEFAGDNLRRLLLAVIHRQAARDHRLLGIGAMSELLVDEFEIELDDEDLIEDLTALRELELIELIGKAAAGHYSPAIPLMGKWIEKQQDFAAILTKARAEAEERNG